MQYLYLEEMESVVGGFPAGWSALQSLEVRKGLCHEEWDATGSLAQAGPPVARWQKCGIDIKEQLPAQAALFKQ